MSYVLRLGELAVFQERLSFIAFKLRSAIIHATNEGEMTVNFNLSGLEPFEYEAVRELIRLVANHSLEGAVKEIRELKEEQTIIIVLRTV